MLCDSGPYAFSNTDYNQVQSCYCSELQLEKLSWKPPRATGCCLFNLRVERKCVLSAQTTREHPHTRDAGCNYHSESERSPDGIIDQQICVLNEFTLIWYGGINSCSLTYYYTRRGPVDESCLLTAWQTASNDHRLKLTRSHLQTIQSFVILPQRLLWLLTMTLPREGRPPERSARMPKQTAPFTLWW